MQKFQKFIFQLEIECTWMRETAIDWIFQGPSCAVLLINLMFLFRIMWVNINFLLQFLYLDFDRRNPSKRAYLFSNIFLM